jgi:hypothetical protein
MQELYKCLRQKLERDALDEYRSLNEQINRVSKIISDLDLDWRDLKAAGHNVLAIQAYRKVHGCDLKDAYAAVVKT